MIKLRMARRTCRINRARAQFNYDNSRMRDKYRGAYKNFEQDSKNIHACATLVSNKWGPANLPALLFHEWRGKLTIPLPWRFQTRHSRRGNVT